ncbi:MAG: GNAT family N-acetyltransferase [Gammaproteobacteria bacterium]|nr:GNAT family N-acetyltransferase [Gammaproteobacteria bacterium]
MGNLVDSPLSPVRVRSASVADQPEIKRVVGQVLEEFGICGGLNPQQDADLDDLAGWYPPPRGVFEVIEDDAGRILGCGGVHPLDEASCELRKLYFLPELRGRGIGSAMLDRLVKFARQAGFKRMELETASVLDAAIAIYEARGFGEVTNKRDVARCDRAFEIDLNEYRAPARLGKLESNSAGQ